MKRLPRLLVLVLLSYCFMSKAQNHDGRYGNEWINYNQKYYKIAIADDGFYRISKQVLDNAGISTSSINPSNYQVFALGDEVPIYVKTNNGTLEYIEFYATKHHGELDEGLYYDSTHHFNKEYSVINDTLSYFLTWNGSTNNRHYTEHISDFTPPLPSPEAYVWGTAKKVYSDTWNRGRLYPVGRERLSKSTFDRGEGFGSVARTAHQISISTPSIYSAGPNARLKVRAYAYNHTLVNNQQHDITLQINSAVLSSQTYFGQHIVRNFESNLPVAQLRTNNTAEIRNTFPNSGLYLAHAHIEYPRTLNLNGGKSLRFKMAASATGVTRHILDFVNLNASGASAQTLIVYDLTNNLRTTCLWDPVNGQASASLPASSTERELLFINLGANSYTNVGILNSINNTLVDYDNYTDKDYIIITHPSLEAKANEYSVYRQFTSPVNKGYDAIVVNIEDLYNQFAYGIRYHPLAVRNFATYIKSKWDNPKYLFLIGKGRQYVNTRISKPNNLLIPTFGHPESDILLVAPTHSRTPSIPIGRLSATTPDQVAIYLNKIKEHEAEVAAATQQNYVEKSWTKNILHLGAGATISERQNIQTYLSSMKTTIEDAFYGGKVYSFFKTTTAPIQIAQSSFLDSLINNGVSLITFFGHSSANSFSFNLDYPENYENYQRYPMIVALGCYSGNMFASEWGLSERFIFESDAGASVFLAPASSAGLSSLGLFANKFYENISVNHYGEGVAKMVQQTIESMEQDGNFNDFQEMVCGYMAYHGDPAFNLNAHQNPDYYIEEQLVSHSPNLVTVKSETFDLHLNIHNLGRALSAGTTFAVSVERTYPNGDVEFVTRQRIAAPYYSDTYTLRLPVNGYDPKTLGANTFKIFVDADEEITETPLPQAESNNVVYDYEIYILSDAITPVYPYEFAIVPEQNITLKASTGLAFLSAASYILQIDTSEYFNSPLKQEGRITQIGGVVEWTPPITYQNEVVYYWRVSPDTTGTNNQPQWSYSSFVYIEGSYPGWNQSHYFQYKKDEFQNIKLEEGARAFDYISAFQELELQNAFTPDVLNEFDVKTSLNSNLLEKCRCASERGIYVQVLEEENLDAWSMEAYSNQYGALNCDASARRNYLFLFRTHQLNASQSDATQNDLVSFLRDTIPDGAYVLLFTLNDAGAYNWNSNLLNHLNSIGVDPTALNNLTNAPGGLPFGFFYKKGHPTYPHTVTEIASSTDSVLHLSGIIEGNWINGRLRSPLIGPAAKWKELHWQTTSLDGLATDYTHVDVYGATASGTEQLLIQGLTASDSALNFVDPTQYPYLRLEWYSQDAIHRSPPQLDYWRITAEMVPEAALRPDLYLQADSDTVERGEPFFFEIAMENLTEIDMDSVLVKFQVIGDSTTVVYKRIAPLLGEDTLRAYTTIPTAELYGPQELLVDINPNFDQLEKHRFNNIGVYDFYVRSDKQNPILDVTFDGVRIMDGDIVSAKPEIMITLDDDNQYLALNDPKDFTILLFHSSFPNGQFDLKTIDNLEFIPADESKLKSENKAQILLTPDLASDGIYTLYVSAKDRSNNNSGDLTFSIDFEVINKPSVSNVLNYPNPFTTSTQFVFTLTGSALPDELKIQIFTVSGRLIREIGMDELGALHVGTNRTEFAWDGTDMYGDRLANGVYLYRVITVKEGEEYERFRNNQIDYMFRQGFGKMYLMR